MGLLARAVEEAGIPTTSVTSALDISQAVKPPRALFVNFPLGNQCGKACEAEGQRRILSRALGLLEEEVTGGAIATWPELWRLDDPENRWEEEELLHPSAH